MIFLTIDLHIFLGGDFCRLRPIGRTDDRARGGPGALAPEMQRKVHRRIGGLEAWPPRELAMKQITLWYTNKKLWKDPPFFMGKLTISIAIFNIYVKLPEGSMVN